MKTGIITYGRFQPPHKGHEMMLNKMLELEESIEGSSSFVFTSNTHSPENPIEPYVKRKLLQAIHPMVNRAYSLFDTLDFLAVNYFTDVIFVAGGDRIEHYTNILNRYNGGERYNFKSIEVINVGERTDDRWSGTYMRELARQGLIAEFMSLCPDAFTGEEMRTSYALTRAGIRNAM